MRLRSNNWEVKLEILEEHIWRLDHVKYVRGSDMFWDRIDRDKEMLVICPDLTRNYVLFRSNRVCKHITR